MAIRSIAFIQQQILDYAYNNFGLAASDPFYRVFHDENNNLITPSATNKFVLITHIVAVAMNLFEQLLDLFKTNLEAEIDRAPVGNNLWLQQKVLEFQYDAADPQIIQLIDYAPSYTVVNPNKRIITQAAVINDPMGGYYVKAVENLTALSITKQNALISYLRHLNFGVPMTVISASADLLMLTAEIYYDGQYNTIVADVTAAIDAHITSFNTNNYNGDVLLSRLTDIIQAVPGVNDVVFRQVEMTPDVGSLVVMVDNSAVINHTYSTYAGYIEIDPNAGRTLADTLTFIVG